MAKYKARHSGGAHYSKSDSERLTDQFNSSDFSYTDYAWDDSLNDSLPMPTEKPDVKETLPVIDEEPVEYEAPAKHAAPVDYEAPALNTSDVEFGKPARHAAPSAEPQRAVQSKPLNKVESIQPVQDTWGDETFPGLDIEDISSSYNDEPVQEEKSVKSRKDKKSDKNSKNRGYDDDYDYEVEYRHNPFFTFVRIVVSVVAILGVAFFCVPIAKSYFTVTSIVAVAFCVCIFLLANLKGVLTKHGERTGMNILWSIVSFLFFLAFCWFGFLTFNMVSTNFDKSTNENATVVVLGARVYESGVSVSLQNRLNTAVDYLNEHKDAKVVVTGGKGSDEPWTEASAEKEYLINSGISEDRILVEDTSTSTEENLANTKSILAENNLGSSIVLVTQNFHMFRASSQAKDLGYDVYCEACKTNYWLLPTYYSRELLALTKYYINKVI